MYRYRVIAKPTLFPLCSPGCWRSTRRPPWAPPPASPPGSAQTSWMTPSRSKTLFKLVYFLFWCPFPALLFILIFCLQYWYNIDPFFMKAVVNTAKITLPPQFQKNSVSKQSQNLFLQFEFEHFKPVSVNRKIVYLQKLSVRKKRSGQQITTKDS